MRILKLFSLMMMLFAINACTETTDVVDSGTYQGTVDEVEPEKTEIYVKTDDGKVLELYFTEETTLTQNNEEVPFSALQKGQNVEVTVEKTGQRLDPVSVKILE